MSELSFEQMFEESSFKRLRTGEAVTGQVIGVKEDEIILSIAGSKSEGIITRSEFTNEPGVDLRTKVQVGDELEAKVLKVNDGEGMAALSYKRLAADKGLKRLKEAFENKEVLKEKVTQVMEKGLVVEVEGTRVFIPASMVSDTYDKDLSKYAGQEIEFVVTEFNPSGRRSRIIGDRKQILLEKKAAMQKELFEKIALSLKFPESNPWANAAEKYAVGNVVEGKVARMTDFGAFVELEPGVDALLHVSQISREHVDKPSDVLSVGQVITAKVVDFNEADRKISLSMKALENQEAEEN